MTLVLVAVAMVTGAVAVSGTGVLSGLEQRTVSIRFSLRHAPRPNDIVVVAIDDRTFAELKQRWPFPRSRHAQLIDRLHATGARAIVYDIQFTEPTAEDEILYNAIGRAGGAVLATSESDGHGHTGVLGGDANLRAVHARAAAANLGDVAGGTITRYPYEVAGLKSIAVVTAERISHKSFPAGRFAHAGAWIDYRGGPGSIPTVSFSDALLGHTPPSTFRGKVVVVGATAPTLQDVHPTPVGGSALMAGPEIQANAISTALHGNPLRTSPGWLSLSVEILFAVFAPLLAIRLRVLWVAAAALTATGVYTAGAQAAFDHGTILPVVPPILALAVGIVATLVVNLTDESSRRKLLEWVVGRRVQQLRESQLELAHRLAAAAESRDQDTGEHLSRIGWSCERLALAAGLNANQAEMCRHASAMHDIGKISIPDRVLLKQGELTQPEWEIMKSHTTRGADILAGSPSPLIQLAETVARTHHERWDGTGYPNRLAGREIPLAGRICAVCDVFDALIHARPYKRAWSRAEAVTEIRRRAGTHLDPALVEAFIKIVPDLERKWPIASLAIDPLAVRDLDARTDQRDRRAGAG